MCEDKSQAAARTFVRRKDRKLMKGLISSYRMSDAGTTLLFKFRSGTHGLNEEFGRHWGRQGKKECVLCDESVSHVLWECPAYNRRFVLQLWASLGGSYSQFEDMSSPQASYEMSYGKSILDLV